MSVSSITLVEMMPTPEMVYTMLDALYRDYSDTPEQDLDAIRYIEKQLIAQDLPLTRDEYEGDIKSPEYNEWKDVDVVFPIPVGH